MNTIQPSDAFPDKLYPIRHNEEYGIIAGELDGRQVMIRFSPDAYLLLTFSDQGDLVSVRDVPYESAANRKGEQSLLKQWVRHDKPIRVRPFFLQDRYLGIKELPSSIQDMIDDPSDFDEEEVAYLQQELDAWKRSKQFVLHWDNEYYLNEVGRVVAS